MIVSGLVLLLGFLLATVSVKQAVKWMYRSLPSPRRSIQDVVLLFCYSSVQLFNKQSLQEPWRKYLSPSFADFKEFYNKNVRHLTYNPFKKTIYKYSAWWLHAVLILFPYIFSSIMIFSFIKIQIVLPLLLLSGILSAYSIGEIIADIKMINRIYVRHVYRLWQSDLSVTPCFLNEDFLNEKKVFEDNQGILLLENNKNLIGVYNTAMKRLFQIGSDEFMQKYCKGQLCVLPGFYGFFYDVKSHAKITQICVTPKNITYTLLTDSGFKKEIKTQTFEIDCSLPLKGRIFFRSVIDDVIGVSFKTGEITHKQTWLHVIKNTKRVIVSALDYAFSENKKITITYFNGRSLVKNSYKPDEIELLENRIACNAKSKAYVMMLINNRAIYIENDYEGIFYDDILSIEVTNNKNAVMFSGNKTHEILA